MKKPKKRILYSNYDLSEMHQDAYEHLLEMHRDEFPNDLAWEPSDDAIWEEVRFLNDCNWSDFEINFKDFFDSNSFVLQGNIGTWRGQMKGGFVFESFRDMSRAWSYCDYLEVFDENGHLYIRCSHHDGSNFFEIRLNDKGYDYYARHKWYDDDEKLHDKLMQNPYSVLPNCAYKIFGCKRKEYCI